MRDETILMLGEGDCVLGTFPKTGPLRYFAVNGFAKLDLLKTEVSASLYRLEGALDADGDC